jgi:formyl-CoA transferase
MLRNELSGITVVSLEQAVAAPYCGLLLADAGARVIKVERPEGDFARGYDAGANGDSAIFAWLNRGKESICLNLKSTDDMALMRSMLDSADVFVSNLAPGAVERLGLRGDDLRVKNPNLITCSITGYGDTGPAAKKKAYDFLVQGESGVVSVTGTPENPARVGVSLTDLSTGLTAFSGILRALIQRGKTGKGIDITVSMFDVMADWMNMPLMAHRYMGGAPGRMGLKHTFIAPYGAFTCGDGGQILLSVQNNREFATLCADVLNQPELSQNPKFKENPDRFTNRIELDAIVTAGFAKFDTKTVIEKLDQAQIANARLNSVADLSDHPFLNNTTAQFNDTYIEMAALPVHSGSGSNQVPAVNANGDQIRQEFTDDDQGNSQ